MVKVTLNDLEIRYKGLREKNPELAECSKRDCKNPIDWAGHMGWDTSCAYHRLLFDFWLYEVVGSDIMGMSKRGRRIAFSRWVNKIGKEKSDKIVLDMANDGINWEC